VRDWRADLSHGYCDSQWDSLNVPSTIFLERLGKLNQPLVVNNVLDTTTGDKSFL
jgi:hypothetical protein